MFKKRKPIEAPITAGLPKQGDDLPDSLKALSRYIKRVNCRKCGAPKTLPSATAYIYCDFCATLMDYDFRLANAGTNAGITNTIYHRQGQTELAEQASIPEDILLELTKITDLSRAPYVGPVYARLLYEAGVDTLEKLSASDPARLLDKLRETNDKLRLTRGGLPTSVPEMDSSLGIVRMIPKVIEYWQGRPT